MLSKNGFSTTFYFRNFMFEQTKARLNKHEKLFIFKKPKVKEIFSTRVMAAKCRYFFDKSHKQASISQPELTIDWERCCRHMETAVDLIHRIVSVNVCKMLSSAVFQLPWRKFESVWAEVLSKLMLTVSMATVYSVNSVKSPFCTAVIQSHIVID